MMDFIYTLISGAPFSLLEQFFWGWVHFKDNWEFDCADFDVIVEVDQTLVVHVQFIHLLDLHNISQLI